MWYQLYRYILACSNLHGDAYAADIATKEENLGLSYLPLAMVAMDALESWSKTLPLHTLQPYYKEILPNLDNYLKTVDQGELQTCLLNPFPHTRNLQQTTS